MKHFLFPTCLAIEDCFGRVKGKNDWFSTPRKVARSVAACNMLSTMRRSCQHHVGSCRKKLPRVTEPVGFQILTVRPIGSKAEDLRRSITLSVQRLSLASRRRNTKRMSVFFTNLVSPLVRFPALQARHPLKTTLATMHTSNEEDEQRQQTQNIYTRNTNFILF